MKNSFESNYLQVRRTSTRPRYLFELNYETITLEEFTILEDHFSSHIGTIFTFTHPVDGNTYQVTYSDGALEKEYKSYNIVDTKIVLESI